MTNRPSLQAEVPESTLAAARIAIDAVVDDPDLRQEFRLYLGHPITAPRAPTPSFPWNELAETLERTGFPPARIRAELHATYAQIEIDVVAEMTDIGTLAAALADRIPESHPDHPTNKENQ